MTATKKRYAGISSALPPAIREVIHTATIDGTPVRVSTVQGSGIYQGEWNMRGIWYSVPGVSSLTAAIYAVQDRLAWDGIAAADKAGDSSLEPTHTHRYRVVIDGEAHSYHRTAGSAKYTMDRVGGHTEYCSNGCGWVPTF